MGIDPKVSCTAVRHVNHSARRVFNQDHCRKYIIVMFEYVRVIFLCSWNHINVPAVHEMLFDEFFLNVCINVYISNND